jgi:hypothetical protein
MQRVPFKVLRAQRDPELQHTPPEAEKSEPSPPDHGQDESSHATPIEALSSQEEPREESSGSGESKVSSHEKQRRTPTPPPATSLSFPAQVHAKPAMSHSDFISHILSLIELGEVGSRLLVIREKGFTEEMRTELEKCQDLQNGLRDFLENRKLRPSQLSDLLLILALYLLGKQGSTGHDFDAGREKPAERRGRSYSTQAGEIRKRSEMGVIV